jgi:hypothetical protein
VQGSFISFQDFSILVPNACTHSQAVNSLVARTYRDDILLLHKIFTMSANFSSQEGSYSASLDELQRGVRALAKNSSRPHKQLVQRGEIVSSTGNVAHLVGIQPHLSVLDELERGIAYKAASKHQEHRPWLSAERSELAITGKIFLKPESSTAAVDILDVTRVALRDLNTSYFDMLSLVLPDAANSISALECWAVMEQLQSQGVAHQIAVGNVAPEILLSLLGACAVKPSAILLNPTDPRTESLLLVCVVGIVA